MGMLAITPSHPQPAAAVLLLEFFYTDGGDTNCLDTSSLLDWVIHWLLVTKNIFVQVQL